MENSVRSDVIGYNIYTMGCDLKATYSRIPHERKFGYMPASNWDMPSFGLHGLIAIGHHLDISDLLTLSIYEDGKQVEFDVARNHWTPAFMKTIYRSKVDADYYPYAGCLCVVEEKCFLPDDTFISNMKICNDKREDCTLTIELKLPLQRQGEGKYILNAKTTAKCLRKQYPVTGFIAARTNEGKDCFTVTVPAGGEVTFSYGFAFDTDSFDVASNRLQNAFETKNPLNIKEKHFNEWMKNNIPRLTTDNTDMLKIYYYRAFVIYRTVHAPDKVIKNHDFKGECVYESPFGTWFGASVGLSVPLQIEEMKWLRYPDSVRSHIKNWKNAAGNTTDYIQFTPWSIWRLYQHYPDKEFISLCYDACKAFTLKDYDINNPEQLPLQIGSWSTGAEYQPAFYQYTSPAWGLAL